MSLMVAVICSSPDRKIASPFDYLIISVWLSSLTGNSNGSVGDVKAQPSESFRERTVDHLFEHPVRINFYCFYIRPIKSTLDSSNKWIAKIEAFRNLIEFAW